jgi:hypothetical protein
MSFFLKMDKNLRCCCNDKKQAVPSTAKAEKNGVFLIQVSSIHSQILNEVLQQIKRFPANQT